MARCGLGYERSVAVDSDDFAARYPAGEIFAGRYRIVKVLGAGGMGVVLAARHLDLDSLVAIKLLRPEVLSNKVVVERFAAEARAAVRIKSEHVARVTDVNTLPDGSPYMVMEYLEGDDLSAILQKGGPLSVENAVDYLLQACEALVEAHSLDIVHRDLKPGNLFLSRRADGSAIVKVLDFGISKSTGGGSAESHSLTSTGTILGSPLYMSPEQLGDSKTVDRRTDIWALGVILHQSISGVLPFTADTLPELVFAIVQRQPPPLSTLRPDVPPALTAVVSRCLEKERSHRFDNVGELAAALAPFAAPRSQLSIERILRMAPAARFDQQLVRTDTQLGDLAGWPWQPKAPGSDTQGTWGHTAARPALSRPKRALRVFAVLTALGLFVFGGVSLRTLLQGGASAAGAASGTAAQLVSAAPPVSELNAALPATATATQSASPAELAPEPRSPREEAPAISPSLARVHAQVPRGKPRPSLGHQEAPLVSPPSAPVSAAPTAARPAPSAAPSPPKPRSDWEEDRQ